METTFRHLLQNIHKLTHGLCRLANTLNYEGVLTEDDVAKFLMYMHKKGITYGKYHWKKGEIDGRRMWLESQLKEIKNNAKKMEQKSQSKPKCFNCKHSSRGFKINGKTHHQCNHPKHEEGIVSGVLSPWDTLQEFYNTCETHEFCLASNTSGITSALVSGSTV